MEDTNWHTGTPTDEGEYRVALEYDGDVTFDTLYWLYDWSYFDEKYKILAWQKIEPYKEEEDGLDLQDSRKG